MEIRKIDTISDPRYSLVTALYEEAFPDHERKDLKYLLKPGQKFGEIYSILDETEWLGFACFLNSIGISHIIYFAIRPELRNQGYGASALRLLVNQKKGQRVIVDLEEVEEQSSNREQRIKRKEFYLRNGFEETPVEYGWHGDRFEILSAGGKITDQEFHSFWENIAESDEDLLY